MKKLSITTRITIWYTAFMLIITVGVLGILVYAGNLRASETAKTLLTDSVTDASTEVKSFGGDFVVDDKLNFYEDGVYISIYDGRGQLIEGKIPGEIAEPPVFDDKEITKMKDDNGDAWYIYDRLFEVDNQFVWVRGMVKDLAEQSAFSAIQRLAIFAFPALIVVAALGGYAITRRGFKPVREMISTVEDIRDDGDLSRRIALDKELVDTEDEVYKLAETFNGMFDRLEKSFEQEKQFTSDVSHELRTPLTVIISQSEYAKGDETYREQALEVIEREAKRMSGLVSRLLTLSRSDSGRLTLEKEKVDFAELCTMIAEQQVSVAKESNIIIETDIDEDVFVAGDEAMIIRIVLNLMDNAIKYGRDGGKVKLSLSKDSGFAVCSVEDNGIGIAEEDLDKIWGRFYRVDGARSKEGEGLGLSMVEALVREHDGKVRVRSCLGEGSCFTVYLPLA